MRTTFPLAVVLCVGIALLLFSGSGFNALVSGSQSPGPVGEAVEQQSQDSAIREGNDIDVSRSASDEGSIAGLILSGAGGIIGVVQMIALAPLTMQRLGFPTWMAVPIGSLFYILGGIGLFQVVSGRIYE